MVNTPPFHPPTPHLNSLSLSSLSPPLSLSHPLNCPIIPHLKFLFSLSSVFLHSNPAHQHKTKNPTF
ncbi:hypothetical protein ACFX13_005812 [Malus domestica]